MKIQHNVFSNIYGFGILTFLAALCSCQKVINVDLNSSAPKLIIDASISDQPGPYIVTLSKSVNFDQLNTFPPVSGAIVLISDNAGNTDTLKESSAGTYLTTKIQGVPGRTYQLLVDVNGSLYEASSTMPFPVNIDTLFVKNKISSTKKIVGVRFADPKGIINYYRIIETLYNTNMASQLTFGGQASDRLWDGTEMEESADQLDLSSGDTVRVSLESVDKNVYDFFRTGDQGGALQTVYSNPTTNIINGALGYFSAYSVRSKKIIIP